MKVVFVHIGPNPTPTLFKAVQVAQNSLPNSEICLISDQKELLSSFPGRPIQFENSKVKPFLKSFIRRNKELKKLAGGYWLNTLSRLFSLSQFAEENLQESFLHLESDVYLYASQENLLQYKFNSNFVSYPRLSEDLGVASIMYVPNSQVLSDFLWKLSSILSKDPNISNDMQLLGRALNVGASRELPSNPELQYEKNEGHFLFDAAPLGQYLLGIDPIHTSGLVTSGYKNPNYSQEISRFRWSIPEQGKLVLTHKGKSYQVLNIHAHSKEILEAPNLSSPRWIQILREANGEALRRVTKRDFENFHHAKPTLLVRLRIARKTGFKKQIKRIMARKGLM